MVVFDVYNADGKLQMDLAAGLTKILGSRTITTGSSGSLSDTRLLEGTPWSTAVGPTEAQSKQSRMPDITFDGSTVSWQGGTGSDTVTFVYGTYSNGSN